MTYTELPAHLVFDHLKTKIVHRLLSFSAGELPQLLFTRSRLSRADPPQ